MATAPVPAGGRVATLALLLPLLMSPGCASRNPHFDPAKPHHTSTGFRNSDGSAIDKSFADLVRWRWHAWRNDLPPAPASPQGAWPFAWTTPDHAMLARGARAAAPGEASPITVTWIGHATVLLQVAGKTILTDPHFGDRASPVSFIGPKRRMPLPATLDELPRIDLVVISHDHYDHLDAPTIRRLVAQAGGEPVFAVPLGNERLLAELGARRIVALDWWERRSIEGLEIGCLPVHHWSARGLGDRNENLWSGWRIAADGFSFVFVGDTGYSADFAEIGRRAGPFDLAAIPIGAYEPRWFMKAQHVNPSEAVQILRDLRARSAMAIHWGTFELTDEPLDRPLVDLAAALAADDADARRFEVYRHGETRTIRR
ncbi:MAG: MBL fold metallo-hydrolase [Lautropia sp.]